MESLLSIIKQISLLSNEILILVNMISVNLGFNPFLSILVIALVGFSGKILIYNFEKARANKKSLLLSLCVVFSFLIVFLTGDDPIKVFIYQSLALSCISTFNYNLFKIVMTGLVNYLISKLNSKFEKDINHIENDDLLP